MNKVRVNWHASDGYVNPGPQSFNIDLDDMVFECDSEDEARQWLDEMILEDFQEKVTPYPTNGDDIIEAWKIAKAAQQPDPALEKQP